MLLREMDERLGLTPSLASKLVDERSPERVQHSLTQMLRMVTYAMAIDSAQAAAPANMGDDTIFKIATCDKKRLSMLEDEAAVASQPTLSRLFAQLSSAENLPHLRTALIDSTVQAVHATEGQKLEQVTLDIDSYPIPVHGHQPGSEHNCPDGCRIHRIRGGEALKVVFLDVDGVLNSLGPRDKRSSAIGSVNGYDLDPDLCLHLRRIVEQTEDVRRRVRFGQGLNPLL